MRASALVRNRQRVCKLLPFQKGTNCEYSEQQVSHPCCVQEEEDQYDCGCVCNYGNMQVNAKDVLPFNTKISGVLRVRMR